MLICSGKEDKAFVAFAFFKNSKLRQTDRHTDRDTQTCQSGNLPDKWVASGKVTCLTMSFAPSSIFIDTCKTFNSVVKERKRTTVIHHHTQTTNTDWNKQGVVIETSIADHWWGRVRTRWTVRRQLGEQKQTGSYLDRIDKRIQHVCHKQRKNRGSRERR